MAKAKSIDGKDLMVTLGGKTVALATSCTINITRAMNSASSKDDGAWSESEPGDISWNVSSDSLFAADTSDGANQIAYDELFEQMVAGSEVVVAFGVVNNPSAAGLPANGWTLSSGMYTGSAYISDLSTSGAKNSPANISVQLTGVGELSKVKA